MSALAQLRRLWDHVVWADGELVNAMIGMAGPPADAVREYAHIIGAEEVWMARLDQRPPRCAVWPDLGLAELGDLRLVVQRDYARLLAALDDGDLARDVAYVNSAGRSFTTPIGDILLHVALHGQYHRGKVNLMLREAGLPPAPTDFISFARGVAAATRADSA